MSGKTEKRQKVRSSYASRSVPENRTQRIKDLLRKPEVRNVDVEAIKASFSIYPESKKKVQIKKPFVMPDAFVQKAEEMSKLLEVSPIPKEFLI